MAFTIFEFDIPIYRSEVQDNFDFLGNGDMLPRGGSGSMTATDAAYNLGSSDEKWAETHIQNLDLADGGSFGGTWQLLSELTLDDTATTIEFTGLNGDSEEIYNIIVKTVGVSVSTVYGSYNGDSGANYGIQRIRTRGASPTAARVTAFSSTVFIFGYSRADTTTVNNLSLCDSYIYAKTGNERLAINVVSEGMGETYIVGLYHIGVIYSDTTTTITSLKFIGTGTLTTNTTIQIWAPNYNTGVTTT